ncbi:MAG: FHA domain-containing protein [Anaerolineaceae bacterium]|nr:MAG: FHA domain-containing protein [Anaerolineaceae bacterium]
MTSQSDKKKRDKDTAILSTDSLNSLHNERTRNFRRYADSPQGKREIVLLIRGTVETVQLAPEQKLILGRLDSTGRGRVDVDLTEYGAVDRGVSREHCTLQLGDGVVFITDMDSTNGTFINGNRLPSGHPCPFHKGDELVLGRLIVQVLFR